MWRRLGRTARNLVSRASSPAPPPLEGGEDEEAAMRSRSSCTRLDKVAMISCPFLSLSLSKFSLFPRDFEIADRPPRPLHSKVPVLLFVLLKTAPLSHSYWSLTHLCSLLCLLASVYFILFHLSLFH